MSDENATTNIEYEELKDDMEGIRKGLAMHLREFHIIKDSANKIGNYFLNAKYNPRTQLGEKFVNSLYDENF